MEGPVLSFWDRRGDASQSEGRVSRLSRARISFPVLKWGIAFFATATTSPVRGLRPVWASRSLTEKAPKPRSSTRSPRRKALTISSSIVLTIFSMSRSKRCGFREEMRFMSSVFIMDKACKLARSSSSGSTYREINGG